MASDNTIQFTQIQTAIPETRYCGLEGFLMKYGCLQDTRQVGYEIDAEFNSLIIHIHGGGFVAMSSGSHQNYTRQ